MREYSSDARTPGRISSALGDVIRNEPANKSWPRDNWLARENGIVDRCVWPLPNVILGVSTEDQLRADERIPDLLATPAAKRIVSAEPLLGPIDPTCLPLSYAPSEGVFGRLDALAGVIACYLTADAEPRRPISRLASDTRLDCVIVGGESGHGARPMHSDWVRALRDQCAAAGVKFFFKQWGEYSLHEIASSGKTEPPIPAEFFRDTNPHYWKDGGFVRASNDEPIENVFGAGCIALRVGKKRSGRLLDGREHNDLPWRVGA